MLSVLLVLIACLICFRSSLFLTSVAFGLALGEADKSHWTNSDWKRENEKCEKFASLAHALKPHMRLFHSLWSMKTLLRSPLRHLSVASRAHVQCAQPLIPASPFPKSQSNDTRSGWMLGGVCLPETSEHFVYWLLRPIQRSQKRFKKFLGREICNVKQQLKADSSCEQSDPFY